MRQDTENMVDYFLLAGVEGLSDHLIYKGFPPAEGQSETPQIEGFSGQIVPRFLPSPASLVGRA